MRNLMTAAVCAAAFSVAACGVVSATANSDREAQARALLQQLASDNPDAIYASMSLRVDRSQVAAQLPFLKSLVPAGAVPEGQTVGWNQNVGTGGNTYTLVRTYPYADRTLQVQTVFLKEGDAWKWVGLNIQPTMRAEATAHTSTTAEPVSASAPSP